MSLGTLTLWLHITAMVTAVTLSYGPAFLADRAYRTGQVAALRGVAVAAQPVGALIPVFYVVGGLLGLWTAINFGYNLLAPWLVIAYVLFAIAMTTGFTFNRNFTPRIIEATAAAPNGPLTPSVTALFTDTRYRLVTVIDYIVVLALLFDMVVKPFS